MGLDQAELIGKLDSTCLNALEGAAGLCVTRTNFNVELEHWLIKLAEAPDTDLSRILRRFEVDCVKLRSELVGALDRLKTGNNRTPTLSPLIETLLREAWVLATIQFRATEIRSGALALALLSSETLARVARGISSEWRKISVEALFSELLDVTAGSVEDATTDVAATERGPGRAATDCAVLDRYTIDLTERARRGEIDAVVGRETEVRQLIDILIRRRQNNPILTGEAGVGKTAIVEAFAQRVASGDVPAPLRDVVVRSLDLALLQAGAGIKGEFENRLKGVIAEVKSSPRPIILFVDEAHALIGAGGQSGQGDAANLLKPALARGELRTIAATTWAEYKKYFEKDDALTRRFQVVRVDEPTEDQAVVMMRAMAGALERHHGVRILDEAVRASVRLSTRFISGRQLPDKSLSLLDTACARVALSQGTTPPEIELARRRIDHLTGEISLLQREERLGRRHGERLIELGSHRESARGEVSALETRWGKERTLVAAIHVLRDRIEAGGAQDRPPSPDDDLDALRADLGVREAELSRLQRDSVLTGACVDAHAVAEIVAGWTGIPVGKMQADRVQAVLDLERSLAERVIGQPAALEAIARRIRTARADLTDPRGPIGVFLLVGPSGVGKTETALALADVLYGGERNLITINMSEYQEAHTVSGLKGSPPGYIGYGEGGVLTEAVRRRPYSVVLLDEVEKAHADVLELFYQVFDKGSLEDGEGRMIDFKNTVILLTSNVGRESRRGGDLRTSRPR